MLSLRKECMNINQMIKEETLEENRRLRPRYMDKEKKNNKVSTFWMKAENIKFF